MWEASLEISSVFLPLGKELFIFIMNWYTTLQPNLYLIYLKFVWYYTRVHGIIKEADEYLREKPTKKKKRISSRKKKDEAIIFFLQLGTSFFFSNITETTVQSDKEHKRMKQSWEEAMFLEANSKFLKHSIFLRDFLKHSSIKSVVKIRDLSQTPIRTF